MEYFDTHAHYDDPQFDNDREEVIKKIYDSGVTKCINVGCDIKTSEISVQIANSHDFIYAVCGIHPSEISKTKLEIKNDIGKIEQIVIKNNKVVGIGEIGLDYHYENINIDMQKFAFIEQIKLANKLNLPVIIHTRDAIKDTIEILNNNNFENSGILHCCPFDKNLAKCGLEKGLYIAFGGICTFKNAKNAREIVNMVPDNKILIETDCPYLAPEPLRGSRNLSSNLKYIVRKIAEFRNAKPEEIADLTYKNAKEIYKIN